jgi:CRP/FNR family transcriptional regulator
MANAGPRLEQYPEIQAAERTSCDRCAVWRRALCGSLPIEELGRLSSIGRQRTVAKGQVIYRGQEAPGSFAAIIAGVVKLSKIMPDGRQQIVGLLFPSDFLGRPFGTHSPYFATAASNVQLCCFGKSQFENLMRDCPSLVCRLFERTLDELDAAHEWMLLLGRKTAEEKLASFLLLLARRSVPVSLAPTTGERPAQFELPLTRTDIADFLGLTLETVSRQMAHLKARGIIRSVTFRSIVIPDLRRLEELTMSAGERVSEAEPDSRA